MQLLIYSSKCGKKVMLGWTYCFIVVSQSACVCTFDDRNLHLKSSLPVPVDLQPFYRSVLFSRVRSNRWLWTQVVGTRCHCLTIALDKRYVPSVLIIKEKNFFRILLCSLGCPRPCYSLLPLCFEVMIRICSYPWLQRVCLLCFLRQGLMQHKLVFNFELLKVLCIHFPTAGITGFVSTDRVPGQPRQHRNSCLWCVILSSPREARRVGVG